MLCYMDWATLTPPTSGLKSQTPWNTISATQLCGDTLLGFKINSMKFKEAVGMNNHNWGAGNVSQINHPRCEQNFQVGFLHILFSRVSLKLKSLFICNILALESFFFSKYSLIPHNPFIPIYFPAIPPLIRLSKARCAQPHLEFCLHSPPMGSERLEPLWMLLTQPWGRNTLVEGGVRAGSELLSGHAHPCPAVPKFGSPMEVFTPARTAHSPIAAVPHINST